MKLSYLQHGFGSNLPLVLLHPFPLNAKFWSNQLSGLSKDRHVIAMNLRGYGSSRVDGDALFNLPAVAKDVRNTMASAQIPKAVFAGCSMGGYVLFEMWRQDPELIAGMVLADTRAEADTDEARAKRGELIDRINSVGTGEMPEMAAGMLSDTTVANKPVIVQTVKQLAKEPSAGVVTKTLTMLAERPDSTATLSTIDVPVLVMVGENDAVTPLSCAEKLHTNIPDAKLVVVPGAGHFSPLENPKVVNAAISDFLVSTTIAGVVG